MSSVLVAPADGGWTKAEAAIDNVDFLVLWGPPGTGKSTFACLHNTSHYFRIYCHEEMSDVDVTGGPALYAKNGGTESDWSHGIGIRSWLGPVRLVIDEVDKAGGSALTSLLAITEDPLTAAFTIPLTGETIRPEAGFKCVATMNVPPQNLPEALKDRFVVQIEITQPHPKAIAALPEDLQLAAKASCNIDEERRVSIRGWRAFAQLRSALNDEEMAALCVFGDVRAGEICDALKITRNGDPWALARLFEEEEDEEEE
jgi:MoxR-like ATPase